MRRSLRHRIPVRLRHHWRVVAAAAVFLAVLVGMAGTSRITPFVTSDQRAESDEVTVDIAGRIDLFDTSQPHTVTLTWAAADYDRMLDAYFADGEKDWLQADLVLDGTRIDDVGIRLKGNSTLAGLTRNGQPAPRAAGPGPEAGRVMRPPAGAEDNFRVVEGGRGPRGMATLKTEEPENVPWLISFDEFAEGRRYQGRAEIAVRPATGMASTTGLNEAVALALVAASGEPSQRFSYSSFTVNDRPTVLRLLVEHPDPAYARNLPGDGVLYKSLARGQFTDQGDDQTAYQDDFDQVNRKGSQDLQPVIDLIRWVEDASDTEFAAGLADRIDVESFARYVALQNLLLNFDDMSGPGRNYYLYYDLDTRKFSVLTWDLNLALSGNPAQGPREAGGMRRRPDGGQGTPPGGQQGTPPGGQQGGQQGTQPGRQPGRQQQGGQMQGPGPGGAPPGGRLGGHRLKERFLAAPAFAAVYDNAYRELYQILYADGTATQTVAQTVAMAKAAGGDAATLDSDANQLRTLLEERRTALAKDPVITP